METGVWRVEVQQGEQDLAVRGLGWRPTNRLTVRLGGPGQSWRIVKSLEAWTETGWDLVVQGQTWVGSEVVFVIQAALVEYLAH